MDFISGAKWPDSAKVLCWLQSLMQAACLSEPCCNSKQQFFLRAVGKSQSERDLMWSTQSCLLGGVDCKYVKI
jgi:hypothetical protein